MILKTYDYFRPRDEFHPKATRTLFVGNISREVMSIKGFSDLNIF